MFRQSLKLLGLILISSALFINMKSSAGELIDWLPEVQYAKSYIKILESLPFALRQDCKVDMNAVNEIEPLLFFDLNGNPRDEEGLIQMVSQLFCSLVTISITTHNDDLPDLAYKLAIGEPIRLSDSVIVDGTKQSLRVFGAFFLSGFLPEALLNPRRGRNLLGDDPCATVRDWVKTGKTIELRLAAFWALFIKNSFEESDNPEIPDTPDCIEHRDGDEESLIEAANAGDLDAAVQLPSRWSQLRFEGTLQTKIEKFELLILENTDRNPYLVYAASVYLIPLYFSEILDVQSTE